MKYLFSMLCFIIVIILPSMAFSQKATGNSIYEENITISETEQSGLLFRQLTNIIPADGCVANINLTLPEIKRGVINEAGLTNWVSGYATFPKVFSSFDELKNRSDDKIFDKCFANALNCGYYMLLELKNGMYLAILPIVSNDIMAFVSFDESKPQLKLCTYGTESYSGKAPLFSWAFAKDPYTATYKCWEYALNSEFCKDNVQWRSKKIYPELYEYLGWCTWEAYEGSITEEIVIDGIKAINNSPVPVRWVIVDDGYLNQKSEKDSKPQLISFGTNKKFPNGWTSINSLKSADKVKWMGVWRNMSGSMYGVSPEHTMTELAPFLTKKIISNTSGDKSKTEWIRTMVIKPGVESSKSFYNAMTLNTLDSGFDFQKVDFQTFNFWMYSGTDNAVLKAHQNNQALENACKENNISLLNCISQCNVNVFNTKYSVISRSSVDIKLDRPKENMMRTMQSFANNMWWGEVLVGDFDMYHTGNKQTAQYLTIARAISGGPVYISDEPSHFDKDVIFPVIFNNGKIIRTLAPATPLPKSLFSNGNNSCYQVIAPTRNRSCAIAAFNFSDKPMLKGTISRNDYIFAPGKMQPYEGLWSLPKEGLVLYDKDSNYGILFEKDYEFNLEQMKGRLFTLAPVDKGWAVIGRSDKYIAGCTYTIKSCSKSSLELILDESGPIVVYNSSKQPKVKTGSVKAIGNGFYLIDLPVGEVNKSLEISLSK